MSDHIYTNKDATAIICPPAIPLHATDIEWCRVSEAQAMVAAAYEVAAYECSGSNLGLTAEDVADDIRDHTPADAREALDAMLAKARGDALRDAAALCDDDPSWSDASDAILALVEKGEA